MTWTLQNPTQIFTLVGVPNKKYRPLIWVLPYPQDGSVVMEDRRLLATGLWFQQVPTVIDKPSMNWSLESKPVTSYSLSTSGLVEGLGYWNKSYWRENVYWAQYYWRMASREAGQWALAARPSDSWNLVDFIRGSPRLWTLPYAPDGDVDAVDKQLLLLGYKYPSGMWSLKSKGADAFSLVAAPTGDSQPSPLTYTLNQYIYFTVDNDRLFEIDENFTLKRTIDGDDYFVTEFGANQYLNYHCRSDDNTALYVIDNFNGGLAKYNRETLDVITSITESAEIDGESFYWPTGVTEDGTHVYVCDAGNGRILKLLATDLSWVATFDLVGTLFDNPGDGDYDPAGICHYGDYIYFVNYASCVIVRVKKDDFTDWSYTGTLWGGAGNGDMDSPTDITTDGTYLYVCDPGNSRIQRFLLDGTYDGKIASISGNVNYCIDMSQDGLYLWTTSYGSTSGIEKRNVVSMTIADSNYDATYAFCYGITVVTPRAYKSEPDSFDWTLVPKGTEPS